MRDATKLYARKLGRTPCSGPNEMPAYLPIPGRYRLADWRPARCIPFECVPSADPQASAIGASQSVTAADRAQAWRSGLARPSGFTAESHATLSVYLFVVFLPVTDHAPCRNRGEPAKKGDGANL